MNILYTCDNKYIWLMGVSVISMFENNTGLDELNVYLLGENITEENKHVLSEIGEKYNRSISVFDVPKLDIPNSLVSTRWPLSAFTRLYAGELLPSYIDRILYLDCDTVIKGSISELETWDVSGEIFWGIKDCIGKEYKKNIGIGSDGLYVNAGVLLINLKELRKISIKDKLNTYMSQYEKMINYADQDVLNGAFNGAIGVLPPQYDVMTIATTYTYKEIIKLRNPTNYYSEEELKSALANPTLIHYTTNMRTIRPWFSNTNHPLAGEFRKYLAMSPWAGKELSEMRFTTMESKGVKILEFFPTALSVSMLGFLHSTVKPLFIKLKSGQKV